MKGLTTAASIWVTAAVGIAVGLDRFILAVGSMVLIYFTLWLGRHTDMDDSFPKDSQDTDVAERTGSVKILDKES